MTNDYLTKGALLKMLEAKKAKWRELKDKHQDVTYENFIDDVILVYSWVIDDVIRME